ncbi:MAG: membrane protein [Silanimonas sp.]|nr:MAG: membrane protein [Silanimonas sp.]GIX39883.1 MAG: membrane protein [Silanimonas sp.]
MNRFTPTLLASALLLASAPAFAGDWWIRGGATHVDPKSDNGRLAAGALQVDIDSNTQLGLSLGRFLTDQWAIDVLAATPFSHTAKLNGAESVRFKHLPPTVSLQYYFGGRDAAVRPFLGAGVNFTWVYDEQERGPVTGARVELENSWGAAAQAGLLFRLSDTWHATADLRWIDIDSKTRLDGTRIGTVKVDPLVFSLMVGTRF